MASPVMRVLLVAGYPEGRRSSFSTCKKRTCDVVTVVCLLGLRYFLLLDVKYLFPSGNNKL